jgi:hypothetical protein
MMELEMIVEEIGSWFLSNWLDIAVLVVTVFVGIILAYHFRKELSFPEQVANVPELLNREYVYREIRIDDKNFSLEDIRRRMRTKPAEAIEKEILDTESLPESNRFAYEASVGLQRIGIMILLGAIPIKLVVPTIGKLIVEDWRYCSKLIEKLRQDDLTLKANKNIQYSRRHAEWLAYASALYIYNNWQGNLTTKIKQLFGDRLSMEKRERELRNAEGKLILSKKAKKEIEEMLYAKDPHDQVDMWK